MSDSTPAVFLSYAREDTAATLRIAEALRAAGVEVWFDQSELRGGDAWDSKIRTQIKECALFLPIISANTQSRHEGYFRLEWRLADQRTHLMGKSRPFLVPVCIDATRDGNADVPDSFLAVQWMRLANGEANDAFCERVKTLLAGNLGRSLPTPPSANVPANPAGSGDPALQPAKVGRRVPAAAWIVSAVVALAAVGWFASRRNDAPASSNAGAGTRPPTTEKVSAPVAAAPATGPHAEAQQLIAKAWEQLNRTGLSRAELEIAAELCRQAAALDANNPDVWAAWSQVDSWLIFFNHDITAERRESARTKSTRAMKLDPHSFEARLAEACYQLRATSRSGLGATNDFYASAEQTLRALLRERENDPRVFLALGILLRNSGRYAEGAAIFDRMAVLPGAAATALNEKGWLLRFAGDCRGALEADDRSIAAQPFDGNLLLRMSLALTWTGDLDTAKSTVAQIPPSIISEDVTLTTALWVFWWRREPEPMLRLLNAVPRPWLASNSFYGPRHFLIGLAQHLAGNEEAAELAWREALRLVEQRLEKEPDSADLLWMKARVLGALGRRVEADAAARLASSVGTGENLEALIAIGNFDRALDSLEHPTARQRAGQNWANLKLNPVFDPLRNEPRFQALLAQAEADPQRNPHAGAKSANATPSAADKSASADKSAPADKSIAVLAFANFGGDKENEYFSDGITEELLNVLAKVPGLRVAARTSAFYFKDKNVPVPEIASKLNVAYVVEGSVQKSGTRVKITAQLIKAADGFHVWSDTFTRELKDVFAMQDEIAGLIAKQLQLTLGDAPRVAKQVNPEAHRLVLEGRYFWAQRNDVAFERAEAAYQRALELDPEFAEAHAGLADVWAIRGWYRIMAGNAVQAAADFVRAKEEVRRAQALNPTLAEPYATLGTVLMNEFKFDESERQFAQAIALNPSYTAARHWHANLLDAVGRLDESLKEIERAISLDPLSPNFLWQRALSFGNTGSRREALEATERALALRPIHPTILSIQALTLWHLGRRNEAIAAARAVGSDLTAQPRWLADSNAIYVLRQVGLQSEAEAYAARALANVPKDDYRYGTTLVALGRGKEALTYLRKLPATALANVYWHPMWDPLREDAQFQPWLVTIGCAAEYKLARETQARMLKEQAENRGAQRAEDRK